MDINQNWLRQRQFCTRTLWGRLCRKHILGWHGQGKSGKLYYRAQRRGMRSDYFISNCISFIHSFPLRGRLLHSGWEGLLGVAASLSLSLTQEDGARVIQRGEHSRESSSISILLFKGRKQCQLHFSQNKRLKVGQRYALIFMLSIPSPLLESCHYSLLLIFIL